MSRSNGEEFGPHVAVNGRENIRRRTLLPDPPVGQISVDTVMHADMRGLEGIAAQRGLVLSELFREDKWRIIQSRRAEQVNPLWTPENTLRFALLQLDGRSPAELADAFGISRVAAQGRMTKTQQWLREDYQDVSQGARIARRWHELLSPPDAESQRMLRALQDRCARMRLEDIFIPPHQRHGDTEKTASSGRLHSRRKIYDYDLIIRILYRRFIEGKTSKEIAEEMSREVAATITPRILDAFYSRVLTKEAAEQFGVKVHTAWRYPEYRRVADMFLKDPGTTYAALGDMLSRTGGSVNQGVQNAGKRLVETRAEYKDATPLVAFLLEYGSKNLFSDSEDRRVQAERIEKEVRSRKITPDSTSPSDS